MGRKKIEIVKLASETQRNVTYGKRSKGLIKKALEISVLSDVDVSLIMFSCTGKLDTFSRQAGIWKMLQRFIQNMPDNERRLISQDNISKINMLAQHDSANRQPNTEAIKKEIMDDDTCNKLLEVKNRLMDPSREAFKSQEQFAGLLQSLENIRQTVVNKRMQMQQGLEVGNGAPQQAQEEIQHPGAEIFGVGNPSPSSNSAQNVEPNATGSPFIDMSGPLPGGHREWVLQNGTMGDPSSSYAAMNFGTGQQNIMDPQLLTVKSEPVSVDIPEFILHPISEEYQEQNMLQGMDFSGGVETTYGQPSASLWDTILNATEPDSTGTAQKNPETFNKDQAVDHALIFSPHTHMPTQQYQGAPEAGFWVPRQGGDHMLLQGIQEFGMGNLSSASVPVYSAQQNAWTPDYEQFAWN